MRTAAIPASINGIKFDAIITRDRSYEADVPEYPVEDGFYVSDAILKKPYQLNVTAFISDTPVTWRKELGRTKGRLQRTLNQLEKLYFSGQVVTFVTSSKVYSSMAITSLTVPETAEMGNAVEVQFTLKQIRVTKAKTVTIPSSYGLSGTTGASGGASSTTDDESDSAEKACSVLYGLLNRKG